MFYKVRIAIERHFHDVSCVSWKCPATTAMAVYTVMYYAAVPVKKGEIHERAASNPCPA
jgi:hypothetical protein